MSLSFHFLQPQNLLLIGKSHWSIQTGHSTIIVGEDDLSEILELLRDNTSQCYNIGSCLKLNLSLLDKIEKEAHSTALRKIISNWILKNYNVGRFGEPTWKGLVEAVAASNGGNSIALAQKIAADHQGTVYTI